MTPVINVTDCPKGWLQDPGYVYIGTSRKHGGPHILSSPYSYNKNNTKDEVLLLYLVWLNRKIDEPGITQTLLGIHNKNLVCHCSPLQCHGNFLSTIADSLFSYEVARGKKDWCNITELGASNRQIYIKKVVNKITLEHGRKIRGEMSRKAQEAAGNIRSYEADWKAYRKKYLDPLLRWTMPEYKEPINGQACIYNQ